MNKDIITARGIFDDIRKEIRALSLKKQGYVIDDSLATRFNSSLNIVQTKLQTNEYAQYLCEVEANETTYFEVMIVSNQAFHTVDIYLTPDEKRIDKTVAMLLYCFGGLKDDTNRISKEYGSYIVSKNIIDWSNFLIVKAKNKYPENSFIKNVESLTFEDDIYDKLRGVASTIFNAVDAEKKASSR